MSKEKKKLFELEYNEILYNDYDCELKQFINKNGHLFITSKRLFFYSENLFGKTEIFIELKKIKIIENDKDILKIILLNNDSYEFKNFKDINKTYNIIFSLYEKINGKGNKLYFDQNNVYLETNEEKNTNQNIEIFLNKNNEVKSFRKISNNTEENYDYKIIKKENSDECFRASFNFGINTFYNVYLKDNGIFPYTEFLKIQNSKLISVLFWEKDDKNKDIFKRSIEFEKEVEGIPFNNLINFRHDETLIKYKKTLVYKVKIFSNKPYGDSYFENIIWKAKEYKKNKIILSVSTNTIFKEALMNKQDIRDNSFQRVQNELVSIIEKSIPLIPKNLFIINNNTESFISNAKSNKKNNLNDEFYILNNNIFNKEKEDVKRSNKLLKHLKLIFSEKKFEKWDLEKKINFWYELSKIILIIFLIILLIFIVLLIKK